MSTMLQENPVVTQMADKPKTFMARQFPGIWPYVRLMRANDICIGLAYCPFAWSLILAANVASLSLTHTALYLALFVPITYCYSGMAGAINDFWDMNFDRKVRRCKSRPLASGELSRMTGFTFFIGLGITCVLLTVPLNVLCQKLIVATFIPLLIQPMSKRLIGCTSLTFGILVNWGVFISWASIMNSLDFAVCGPLYVGAICWSILYDMIYGAQDKKDDAASGQKSMILMAGSNARIILGLIAVGTIAGITTAGMNAGMEWPYYLGMVVCSIQLINQVLKVDLEDPEDCAKKYDEHLIFGLVVFVSMLAGSWNLFQGSSMPVSAWHEL